MVMDETHVVNQMKEDTCYVSSDFTADVETARSSLVCTLILLDYCAPYELSA